MCQGLYFLFHSSKQVVSTFLLTQVDKLYFSGTNELKKCSSHILHGTFILSRRTKIKSLYILHQSMSQFFIISAVIRLYPHIQHKLEGTNRSVRLYIKSLFTAYEKLALKPVLFLLFQRYHIAIDSLLLSISSDNPVWKLHITSSDQLLTANYTIAKVDLFHQAFEYQLRSLNVRLSHQNFWLQDVSSIVIK